MNQYYVAYGCNTIVGMLVAGLTKDQVPTLLTLFVG